MMRAPPAPAGPGVRTGLRRLGFGLTTLFGAARRGFFIPYRYAHAVHAPEGRDAYPALVPMFEAVRPRCAAMLETIEGFAPALAAAAAAMPRWDPGWFPPLDAACAYAMVRTRAPSRIVEIGSGHSTHFLAAAVRDGGLATCITAIDPAPRAALPDGVTHVAAPLGAMAALPETLAAGDMLFVDSSHVLMPGTDVDAVLNRLWPALAPGAVVHFHDIFLPDGYPAAWRWRGYNEQSGVGALLAGGAAEILFASRFAATRLEEPSRRAVSPLGRPPGPLDSSLWLAKRGGAPPP